MAKGGAFNVSQLIRELGLQTVSGEDLRVLETIQPVLNVGDLSDVTPPHVAASSMFGDTVAGGVGLNSTIEVQCLAPGGLFIEWFILLTTVSNVAMRVTTVTLTTGLPVLTPAGQTSRDPIVSIVRSGAVAPVGGLELVALGQTGQDMTFGANPIFVPRGSFFSLQTLVANVTTTMAFMVREVPASEHSPT